MILFIGDGLGSTTITSSRILRGQINGMPGEETILKFEEFPHVALSKVRMLNYMYHYSECFIMPPSCPNIGEVEGGILVWNFICGMYMKNRRTRIFLFPPQM